MTTYGYARVSTDIQSTALQTDALRAAGVLDANVLTDDGVSGSVPAHQRPALATLLAKLVSGDTLVVYSVSRLGRNMRDVVNTLHTLDERHVTFRSLTEGFDTSTPMGRAMVGIVAVFAQLEREMTIERTRAGMVAARAAGVSIGRPSSVSPERRAALAECLAAGMTVAQAARECGLSETTARRIAAR
jgi:DNA invertase Pin-like site-specific DNA recombinase